MGKSRNSRKGIRGGLKTRERWKNGGDKLERRKKMKKRYPSNSRTKRIREIIHGEKGQVVKKKNREKPMVFRNRKKNNVIENGITFYGPDNRYRSNWIQYRSGKTRQRTYEDLRKKLGNNGTLVKTIRTHPDDGKRRTYRYTRVSHGRLLGKK